MFLYRHNNNNKKLINLCIDHVYTKENAENLFSIDDIFDIPVADMIATFWLFSILSTTMLREIECMYVVSPLQKYEITDIDMSPFDAGGAPEVRKQPDKKISKNQLNLSQQTHSQPIQFISEFNFQISVVHSKMRLYQRNVPSRRCP